MPVQFSRASACAGRESELRHMWPPPLCHPSHGVANSPISSSLLSEPRAVGQEKRRHAPFVVEGVEGRRAWALT